MFKRAKIVLNFEVDLDAVPGWGHQPRDWIELIISDFQRQTHYNASVSLHSIEVKPKVFVEGFGWTNPQFSVTR